MWQSLKISHLILRLFLAFAFLWFGVDKFFHPSYWLESWIPHFILNFASFLHIPGDSIVYSFGVVELLVGVSLATNMFVDFFAIVAIIVLALTSSFHGFNELISHDVVVVGGLLALIFWPNPGLRRYT